MSDDGDEEEAMVMVISRGWWRERKERKNIDGPPDFVVRMFRALTNPYYAL